MAVSIRSFPEHPEADPRAILDRVPVGVYFTTLDGRIVMANAAVRRILGMPEDVSIADVQAAVAADFYVDLDDRRRWQEEIESQGAVHGFEMRVRRVDGTIRWVRDSGRVVRNEQGEFAGYEGTWEDVTEQRLAEEALQSSEHQLRLLVDQLPLLIWTADAELRYTSAKGMALSSIGMRAEDIVGLRMAEMFELRDVDHPQLAACRAALGGHPRVYRSHLQSLSFQTHIEPLRDATGTIVGIIGVSLNITDREHAIEALARSESQLAVAQRTAHLGSWETDLRTGATTCSEELLRMFGIQSDALQLDLAAFKSLQHPDDQPAIAAAMREAQRSRNPYNVDHRIIRPDGSVRWLQERGEYRYDENGATVIAIGTCFDITDRKLAEEHLVYQARHDALTGLPNRVLLYERLAEALAAAGADGTSVAVLFIDLDRFKYINDTLGHEAGDAFLKSVSRRLRGCAGEHMVARFGGDEFIVVLTGVRDPEAVAATARTIVEEFTTPVSFADVELYTTVSVGISVFPFDGTRPEQLVRSADTAMYTAKDHGRNTFRFFTEQMHASAAERLRVETDLRRAIAREEFVLHYQPIVAPSGRIVALEALVRWQHPTKGLIFPDAFIPIAEDTGLIVPLGEWVLRTACTQLRSWDASGLAPIRIAVNISGQQFARRSLVDTVKRVVFETGIAPERIELELTESVVMKDVETTIVLLEELKAIGVRISVDDFGTGYSSLSYLKRFPIDALKIDRTFTRDTPFDREDTAIVEAVIALAHSLGLCVVAEGVETAAQQGFLRLRKCDEMQGYFFGRPASAEDIAARLMRRAAV